MKTNNDDDGRGTEDEDERDDTRAGFAHFELGLLGLRDNDGHLEDFCVFLLCYSIVKYAQFIKQEGNPMTMRYHGSPRATDQIPPLGFDRANPVHRAVSSAMLKMHLDGGDMDVMKDCWNEGQRFLEANQLQDDKVFTRVSLKLLHRLRSQSQLNVRDLRVLLACNSCFGEKGWHIINATTIGRRAVGAQDPATLERLELKPLSRRQVQRSLVKLQKAKFIIRIVHNHYFTFAANPARVSLPQLKAIVSDWNEHRQSGGQALVSTSTPEGVVFSKSSKVRGEPDFDF